MPFNSNEKEKQYWLKKENIKDEILGKNSSRKVQRIIIFHYAKKLGLDICYRCSKPIEDFSDFHIDHKEPWAYKPNAQELYYDPENLALSHSHCNIAHRRCPIVHINKQKATFKYRGVVYQPERYAESNGKGSKKKWYKSAVPYRACISSRKHKTICIGYFATAEEAALAYDKAVVELRGDRAVTNKMLGLL